MIRKLIIAATFSASLFAADIEALIQEAELCMRRGVQPNYDRAIALYREAADAGSAEAACELGKLYSSGIGEPRGESDRPLALFQKAADADRNEAIDLLSERHRQGLGTERDLLAASYYYARKRAETPPGRPDYLRSYQLSGDPEAIAIVELDKLFEDALKRRNTEALLKLAKFHADGTHGKPNPARAAAFYALADSATPLQLTDAEKKTRDRDLAWMRRIPAAR